MERGNWQDASSSLYIIMNPTLKTIDDYISRFPKETQKILRQVRATIRKAAPGAGEKISYAMPAYTLGKTYVAYFAAFKHHIGFYPTPTGLTAFQKDFTKYKTGKGSIQFPLDRPMPLALIARIVKFRLKEIRAQTKEKKAYASRKKSLVIKRKK